MINIISNDTYDRGYRICLDRLLADLQQTYPINMPKRIFCQATENDLKLLLRNYDALVRKIHRRVLYLFSIQDVAREQAAESASLSIHLKTTNSGAWQDMSDAFIRYRSLLNSHEENLCQGVDQLIRMYAELNRIFYCVQVLPEQEFTIIKALYIDQQLYRSVEKEMEMNHRAFEKKRKNGLQQLKKLYVSDMSDEQLIALSGRMVRESSGQQSGEKSGSVESDTSYDQISLSDIF